MSSWPRSDCERSNTLIGTALNLLTEDEANQQSLKTSLGTLTRVLDKVDWSTLSKDKPEAWLYFYEHFLEVYDNRLRKLTGSYYTPPEVVEAMVNLVDQALRGPLFERAAGLASSDVTLADPAVGTGTFLLGALRKIATNVEKDQGAGAVGPAIAAAAKRLFGFEMQFGPFAVAQLRLLAEMRALTKAAKKAPPELNLYITDTLGNPFVEEEQLPQIVEAIAKSRREANRVNAISRSPSSSAIRRTRRMQKGTAAGSKRARAASSTRRSTDGRRLRLGRRCERQAPQELMSISGAGRP